MADEAEDVATDTSVDVEEATDSNENSDQEDTVEETKEDVVPRKDYNIAWMEAKRAKAELKKLKEAQANPPINNDPQLTDELKLIARGLSDEEIDHAKVVAKGKGIALTEAIKDPLFLIYQNDLKDKKRKEDAKLGASKGSGETEPEVSGLEPGSSRDEHKKAFDKLVGK